MNTQILDISEFDENVLKRAQVFGEKEASDILKDTLSKIKVAAEIIKDGGLVAFPTETVYGLGANALDPDAVGKIYKAKGRPSDNPMIVHIASRKDVDMIAKPSPEDTKKIIDNFWPGPLTIILEKKELVPPTTTGGLDTVAIRMPNNFIALELIKMSGTPIAAPSANLSGKPSPTKALHVIEDLDGRIDAILVGSDSNIGLESTVIDLTVIPHMILRPGIINEKDLADCIGSDVDVDESLLMNDALSANDCDTPKSPGMKYKHYAPVAEMIVVEGRQENVIPEIERLKSINEKIGRKVGVIFFKGEDLETAAHNFYSMLRSQDDDGVDLIIAGAVDTSNAVGFALMNRMRKSAGNNIVRV